MSPPFDKLAPRIEPGLVNIIVDTQKGSRSKFKYDEEIACFRLRRILPEGASFPFSVRGPTWNPCRQFKRNKIGEEFRE